MLCLYDMFICCVYLVRLYVVFNMLILYVVFL